MAKKKSPISKNPQRIDSRTFRILLEANDIGTLLINGGRDLTVGQMKLVKQKAKENTEKTLIQKQLEVASMTGWKEQQLSPGAIKVSKRVDDLINVKATQLTNQFSSISANKLVPESQSDDVAVDVLGQIYDLLTHANELKKVQSELDRNALQMKNLEEEQRNQEIIKALRGISSKTEKPKIKEEKVYQPKKTEPVKAETQRVDRPQKVERPVEPPKQQTAQPTTVPNAPAPTAQPAATTPIIPSIVGAAAVSSLAVMASSVLAESEGFASQAYRDGKDRKTGEQLVSIGYGHQIKPNEYKQGYIDIAGDKVPLVGERGLKTKITKKQAKKLLEIDIPKYEDAAKQPLGESWNKLSDKQKTALLSYSYNTGGTADLVRNGLKDAIDSGDMNLAAKIIYEKGKKTFEGKPFPPLEKRRAEEAKMFLDGSKIKPVDVETATPTNLQSLKPTGTQLNNSSQENKDMKNQLQQTDSSAQVNINNSTTNSGGSSSSTKQKGDDRPAIVRKSQEK